MEPKGGPRVQNGAKERPKGDKIEPKGAKRRPQISPKSISEGGRENDAKIGRPGMTFWDVFGSKNHLKSGKKTEKRHPKNIQKSMSKKSGKTTKKAKITSKINIFAFFQR